MRTFTAVLLPVCAGPHFGEKFALYLKQMSMKTLTAFSPRQHHFGFQSDILQCRLSSMLPPPSKTI